VDDQPTHCRAPGVLAAIDGLNSAFPVVPPWQWCYGHRYSLRRVIKQLWKKLRYGTTDCTFHPPASDVR